jgi:hypothetical protein
MYNSKFFGEDPSSLPMADLFKLFFQFIQDYKQAEGFLEQERVNAERAAKKAAEEEKKKQLKEAKLKGTNGNDAKTESKDEQKVLKPAADKLKNVPGHEGGEKGNVAIVDKVMGSLTGKADAKDLVKLIQKRRRKSDVRAGMYQCDFLTVVCRIPNCTLSIVFV